MSADRPCSEWWHAPCVVSPKQGELSHLCQWFQRCMYAAPRDSFTPEEREVLDAWFHGTLCLLAYRPVIEQLEG